MHAGVLRIGNVSGFYGDRASAMREMVQGGDVDVITGDYLAELTMLILWRSRQKDPAAGYAKSFLRAFREVAESWPSATSRSWSTPVASLRERWPMPCGRHWRSWRSTGMSRTSRATTCSPGSMNSAPTGQGVRHLDTGEPLAALGRPALTANAYLGGWGIAAALARDADIVITGRVTDASLVVGPAAWHFGWQRDDWDRLAGAVVAGHVIECGRRPPAATTASSATSPT
jgi:hypothetical protein